MIRLCRNFITLLTLCMVTAYPENLKYELNNNKLRDAFNKLLKTVTSVSQERLNALNKFNELQNYLPKVGLRSDDEIVAVIIPSETALNHNTDENYIYNNENVRDAAKLIRTIKDENVDDDIDSKDTSLRQWKGCNKSAAKTCRRACKRAYKDVCEDYKCSRSMKKSHKKACKRVCNSEFRGDDY